ncbi:glycoside hydrolase family 65 protein [Halobacillus sp. H74]|uniref:glycoside hydrolase family 65 protein n=1 Tax=Halobacillus sp. H74 TaxID=3457436 RepID=UPI003FCCD664
MKNLKLSEESFNLQKLNKFGTLMTLGNGYMGVRGVHEENLPIQRRGFFIAGIYNNTNEEEPEEIVNLPDVLGVEIEIDGRPFSSLCGKITDYQRTLHMDRGEITHDYLWKSECGLQLQLSFHRLVAKHDQHAMASRITLTSLNKPVHLSIRTGIDAQQTNHGRQHLKEENVRVYDEQYMQGVYKTTRSNQSIVLSAACRYSHTCNVNYVAKNRQLIGEAVTSLREAEPFTIEKFISVYTSLDEEEKALPHLGLEKVKELADLGYDKIRKSSVNAWGKFWNEQRIEIHSPNAMDQLAIDFAQYHLQILTPKHNNNLSMAAKGLTGEGYKGHVFWDTEIFMLPYHLYNEPETAKSLLEYRYNRLFPAKELAAQKGYKGVQFPWESARTGKEETPEYAAINIKTGKRQKVASALAEHHIVADIAFAALHYYKVTDDKRFMREKGLELLKEVSEYWLSRTVERNGQFHILNVIGPDEYTEFIDNNAYTNYMVHYVLQETLEYMSQFNQEDLKHKARIEDALDRLYLPQVNEDKLIPQDDTFLNKPAIDLTKYKQTQGSQSILLDYSREEVNEMQVLKQADVVMLLYLFPHLFSQDVMKRNYRYYEERTIHDSSLSKAIHSIIAMRSGENERAYQLFQEACLIDLGPNPKSSDEGIHGASLGALWLAVSSFLNMQFRENTIHFDPQIPESWSYLKFPFYYRQRKMITEINGGKLYIRKVYGPPVQVEAYGQRHYLEEDQLFEIDKLANYQEEGS